jgi:hypothetical protein
LDGPQREKIPSLLANLAQGNLYQRKQAEIFLLYFNQEVFKAKITCIYFQILHSGESTDAAQTGFSLT